MTFSSVYEMFDPLTRVRKQRFWEWFSGDDIKAWWTQTAVNGSPTFDIFNGLNTGLRISIVASTASHEGKLNFNNKRQYAHDGSVFIAIGRHGAGSFQKSYWGFHDDLTTSPAQQAEWEQDWANTYQRCVTNDGGTKSGTDTDQSNSETNAVVKLTLTGSNCNLSHNGVSKVDKTTDLPTSKMQPVVGLYNNGSSNRGMYCQYLECYNT